jgi:hypothetical protein
MRILPTLPTESKPQTDARGGLRAFGMTPAPAASASSETALMKRRRHVVEGGVVLTRLEQRALMHGASASAVDALVRGAERAEREESPRPTWQNRRAA